VAGADISEIAAQGPADGRERALTGQRAFRRFEHAGKPVIAAVNGFALGGGCELAMACHLRIASATAQFGQPEVRLGLGPGYGGTVRLPRLVGRGRALELLLTGQPIDADEAFRIGLVNKVVPAEKLLEESEAVLRTILANGPLAGRSLHWAVEEFGKSLMGDVALTGEHGQFPLLIKFLDAREDLSLQVHPNAEYAATHPGAHLKSEAWYVIENDPAYAALPVAKAQAFARAAMLPEPESPIVPLVLGGAQAALDASRLLEDHGFLVAAIRPPTVPEGTARLRLTFTAQHPDAEIERLAEVVRERILVPVT